MSKSERISRGMRVMFRTMRPRRNDLTLPEIQYTRAGDEYHVYYPRGRVLRTVMVVYGMSIEGEEDGRMKKFARACTNAGLKVVIPYLPGLREFIVAADDMQRLERILGSLPEKGPSMALIGFSTGGSYVMLLAANPELKHKIGPVILFSPIYDLREVAERLHTAGDTPQNDKDWDQFYWAQFVIAFRNRSLLGLSNSVSKALPLFLADYDRITLKDKRDFYITNIAPHCLSGRTDLFHEGAALDRFSARGKLAEVTSPIFILHDAGDHVVPPEQSRRMHAELSQRGTGFRQDILVTVWLSHVVLRKTGSLPEFLQFITLISELFSELPVT